MFKEFLFLFLIGLIPIGFAIGMYLIDKKTKFNSINPKLRSLAIGLVFGLIAILTSEIKVKTNNTYLIISSAAVIIPGILFNAQAGVIAGILSAIEQIISLSITKTPYVNLSTPLSLLVAGFYSFYLRKRMFDDKKPSAVMALAVGIVNQVFNMLLVFILNMNDSSASMILVREMALPSIIMCGLTVMIACLVLNIFKKEMGHKPTLSTISGSIQKYMLIAIAVAFTLSSLFIFNLQNKTANRDIDSYLESAINDISDDIMDASDKNLLEITREINKEITPETTYYDLIDLTNKYNVAEISIVNDMGIITKSNVNSYIGFDIAYGEQSMEFLCLLQGRQEYVQEYGPIALDETVYRKYAGVRNGTGFVQVGYNEEQFRDDINNELIGVAANRRVGSTGYILILDQEGNIISATKGYERKDIFDYENKGELKEGNTYLLKDSSQEVFARFSFSEGYIIVSVYPKLEAYETRDISIYVNIFLEIIIFAVLYALIFRLIQILVVSKIKDVNKSLGKITAGDLNEIIDVKTNEEFDKLSKDINSTVNTLKGYIDEASKRIDEELEFARNIQTSSLPTNFPIRQDFEIYALMDTAKEVGGDFYDFYMTKKNTLNFLIADVSGKGIPAAMFMMRAKTELKSLTETGYSLSEVFTKGNKALCEGNDAGMFVTAWQASVDLDTGVMNYVNAGHNPPVIKHKDGSFEFIKSKVGFVLAGMEEVQYKEEQTKLEVGDTIYLYTDGVTEATNGKKELFTDERLLSTLNKKEYKSMKELCSEVKNNVDAFASGEDQFDDITMVAFRYMGDALVPVMKFDKAQIEDITKITEFVESELNKIDCPTKTIVQINIAIDELYSNIVKYAYKKGSGPAEVKLLVFDNPRRICVRFTDEGIPYNPLNAIDPDITLSAEEREIGGLGIYMVKKSMDDIKYKYEGGKNILTIIKRMDK